MMSRKNKFRAWDNTIKAWVGNFWHSIERDERLGITFTDTENLTIEQYTGLKDKNGKEIYEGDIIKGRWCRARHARFNVLGKVMFAGCAFKVEGSPDGEDRDGVFLYSCYDIEVIGNIHENADLIREKGGEK